VGHALGPPPQGRGEGQGLQLTAFEANFSLPRIFV
jgi:hypothetical protein